MQINASPIQLQVGHDRCPRLQALHIVCRADLRVLYGQGLHLEVNQLTLGLQRHALGQKLQADLGRLVPAQRQPPVVAAQQRHLHVFAEDAGVARGRPEVDARRDVDGELDTEGRLPGVVEVEDELHTVGAVDQVEGVGAGAGLVLHVPGQHQIRVAHPVLSALVLELHLHPEGRCTRRVSQQGNMGCIKHVIKDRVR